VLTYVVLTRPKAPNQVLLVVRYKDAATMRAHNVASEHQDAVKKIDKMLERSIAKSTTIWREVEDSFVSTALGGNTNSTTTGSRL